MYSEHRGISPATVHIIRVPWAYEI